MIREHPSVYEEQPIIREDYEDPIVHHPARTPGAYEEAAQVTGLIGLGESFGNGFSMIKMGGSASVIKSGAQASLSMAIALEDDPQFKKLSVEEASAKYPETKFTEPIHPAMALYYSTINRSENKTMEEFASTGLQTDSYGNLIASWAGMLAGTLADVPEMIATGAIGGAIGGPIGAVVGAGLNVARRVAKTTRLVMRATKMAKLAAKGTQLVTKPMLKMAASPKLARAFSLGRKTRTTKGARLAGALMIKNADDMLRQVKKAKRIASLKAVGKTAVANAAIESGIVVMAQQRGATYDMKTAAVFGLMAPVVLHGVGRALMGVGAPVAKVTAKAVKVPVKKAVEVASIPTEKFFKDTKLGQGIKVKLKNFNFNLAHKVAKNWSELLNFIDRRRMDPRKLKLLDDGMSGRALSENPLIQKIERVFGKKGVQQAQLWAANMTLSGVRVHLQDAFPWLSKSVDDILLDIQSGKMSAKPYEAFRGKFQHWDAYIRKHTIKKIEPRNIPLGKTKVHNTKMELKEKIKSLMNDPETNSYGKDLDDLNKLTDDFTNCFLGKAA